jgi:DNA-binding PadR family transcriptional regulator
MFRDKSLIPAEAVRLVALGLLADEPRRYGDLALAITHFNRHVVGTSLDLMGASLEALRYEGLVEAVDGQGMTDNAVLRISERGMAALRALLQAQLRAPVNDLNRLALVLKLRFLHHLGAAERRTQLGLMADSLESERTRLEELQRAHTAPGLFADWLEHELSLASARIDWLRRRNIG